MTAANLQVISDQIGVWVSEKEYATLYGLRRATLTSWRCIDKRKGLSSARPGYPIYKRVGSCIRYQVEDAALNRLVVDQSKVIAA